VNFLDFLADDALTPDQFTGETWNTWRAVWGAVFGLHLTPEQEATFKRVAGGRDVPTARVREFWAVAGRRSAKSHMAAAAAVYLATIGAAHGLTDSLSRGERGVIALIAVDRPQARVLMGYVTGIVEASALLAQMVTKRDLEALHFNNRVSIEVHTNSFRSVRGRTLIAALLDEVAFFRSDTTATPDVETYRALVPGLATTGGLLVGISSPYARRGLLFDRWKKHFGKAGDVLVVQGATRDFNPTLDPRVIEEAEGDDPASAKSEWHGLFRDDVEEFLSLDLIDAAMRDKPIDLPPVPGVSYGAFCDMSGGGQDEHTLAIAHREGNGIIIDTLEGRHGDPEAAVAQFAATLRRYGVRHVRGDRYSGEWIPAAYRRHGITYEPAPGTRTELYLAFAPALRAGQIELPPDEKLARQFMTLERRTTRGGRDIIDHSPGSHDDRSNAVAGVVATLTKHKASAGILLRHRGATGRTPPIPEKEHIAWDRPL